MRFGGITALQDVSLALPSGGFVGLVGPNGAGKTTLFGVLSGLLRPTEGRVFFDGEDVTRAAPQKRARMGLARTFQHPELFTGLTVREHLALSFRAKQARKRVWSDILTFGALKHVGDAEGAIVEELLELLGLESVADYPASGLPLGMMRLVELGRALSASPTVLLLDEPFSGLDSAQSDHFQRALMAVIEKSGISVVMVEHDVDLVMRLSDTIFVLDFGQMLAVGSPSEIQQNSAVRAAYLGEADSVTEEEVSVEAVVSEATGPSANGDEGSMGRPLLAVENLSVHYGDAMAINRVTFNVWAGETVAVLGANGAGKSSLARALSGLVRPSAGRIVFADEGTESWAPHRIRQAGVLHLPEGSNVFRNLTVLENLRIATAGLGTRQAQQEGIELAFQIFPRLAERRKQMARSLSGGEQQMVSLARALATSPTMLIADELSLGLAPQFVDVVFEGLDRARHLGVTIILIEQYIHRALSFADKCLVMQRGEIVWSGAAAQAASQALGVYLGDAAVAAAPPK